MKEGKKENAWELQTLLVVTQPQITVTQADSHAAIQPQITVTQPLSNSHTVYFESCDRSHVLSINIFF